MDDEALNVLRVVNELSETVIHLVEYFLANGVVSASEVVRGIFLAVQEELRVENLCVVASPDIIHHCGFQVYGDVTRDVLPGARLLVERGKVFAFVLAFDSTVLCDFMFEAILLPNGVTELNSGLSDVDCENFA